jgi:ElaB/YqjD/DUF883 family membrane-anchored ribosome-binding protein
MSATSVGESLASAAVEIERMKSVVEGGAENAVRAAKQTLRRARHAAEDASEEVVHQMKRHPLESAGVAFGVGLCAGVALGFGLFRRRTGACE